MTDENSSELSSTEVEDLYCKHSDALRQYLVAVTGNCEDANDCLQSAFEIAQRKGGTCRHHARRAWLFRVAYHEAMQMFRRRKRDETTDSGQPQEPEQEHIKPIDVLIEEEKRHGAQLAYERLPTQLRQIVQLRIHEGLKFREIAEQLNVPLGTVLARMQSAIKKLASELNDE